MNKPVHRRLDQLVVEAGLIEPHEISKLHSIRKNSSTRLSRLMIEKGLVTEEQLHCLFEEKLKIPRINLNNHSLDRSLLKSLPAVIAKKYKVVPVGKAGERLVLAMFDPTDLMAIDEVSRITGMEIDPVTASSSAINHLITHLYQVDNIPDTPSTIEKNKNTSEFYTDVNSLDNAPLVKMVDALIEKAKNEEASDIHIEPGKNSLRVRFRLDGVLHDLPPLPLRAHRGIVSRIKIMANLDIAEKRLAQDGNIDWSGKGKNISIRVSTLPTVHGEKVVMRLLEKGKIVLPLNRLGFTTENYDIFLRLLLNQNGLLLVTGPTGSGKTTSLYSALNYLNRPEVNIITVEDPVEYKMAGINQVQVNTRINRTFAGSLRSILRQDPDIIMVGEIRDLETARIACQAAMTGHLVLSTLHTNNAASAVTRLVDMGLENYIVSPALVGVVAQRLVRKICQRCAEGYEPGKEEKLFYQAFFGETAPDVLKKGIKCQHCNNTGYRGRTSIQEILVVNRAVREAILKGANAESVHQIITDGGMKTIVADGMNKVKLGITTLDEIIRTSYSSAVSPEEELNMEKMACLAGMYRKAR